MTCTFADIQQVRFDAMIPYVAVSVDGVPENVIGHNLRLSAIEFARQSQVIRRTVWIDAQECVSVYYIPPRDAYSIVSISSVCYGSMALRGQASLACCNDMASAFFFEFPGTLYTSVSPGCDEARAFEVHMSVAPGQDSCTLDKWVYDAHAEDIAHGAIRRLRLMQDEPWYNPQLAVQHGRYFQRAVSDAALRSRSGNHSQGSSMRMPSGVFV